MTFGLKLALWHAELERHSVRVARARATIAVGKLSGAVGTFSHLPPEWKKRSADVSSCSRRPSPPRSSSVTGTPRS
jgi:adenylosuccinate lyase